MSTTFLNTNCLTMITPTLKITHYDPTSPTGTVVSTINLTPNQKYQVVYYDPASGEVSNLVGYFRKALMRAELLSSRMVDLVTPGCPDIIESLVFDYSIDGQARAKILDISNIRTVSPVLG